tara:strand:+ start:1833 stop:2504 length:672 start_codon:yes stop_codon:yes gene_type:complete
MTALKKIQEFPFFVDVGNGNKMYTLRGTYQKNYGCTTNISSCHIMSLSSDYETAVKKANQYAIDNNVRVVISEHLPKTLNKITQRTPEEVAEEKRYIAKRKFMAKELSSLRMIKSSARNGLFNINKLRTKYTSSHVGQIDDRIDLDCTLEFIHTYATYYGDGVLNSMKDANGNVITYFGSRPLGEKGDKVTFSAKIKKHDEYKGIKQTIIQRPTKIKNHTREW